jgi:prepilin-type N-terminal cleavage/methylation domain-containing protein
MSRRDGFTLLELCLVIMIMLLLVGLAVPSLRGLFAEQELKKTFEQFDDFVRRTQMRAATERRAMVMIWDGEGITVQPDEPTAEDTAGEADYFPFTDGVLALERPAALEEKPAVEWLFWRSGTCEPAIIHFEGNAGAWSVEYDPLTVRAAFLEQQIK